MNGDKINGKPQQPMLSIVVPVYNVEDYLRRCLDSILAQTFQDYEVICVDDGSTDGSLGILKEYEKKDSRIKVIQKENGGQTSARKVGVTKAVGSYVAFVDADDWIQSEMYHELIVKAEKYQVDMVTSGDIRDYGDHIVYDYEQIREGFYEAANLIQNLQGEIIETKKFFRTNISPHVYNKIYRKELVQEVQEGVNESIRIGEDAVLVYECILKAKKIFVLHACFYHYCIRENSVMGVKKESEEMGYEALWQWVMRLGEEYKDKVSNISQQLQNYYTYILLLRDAKRIVTYTNGVLYPYGEVKPEEELVIYGAGKFGKELYHVLKNNRNLNLVAWIDKNAGGEIQNIEILKYMVYDKVLIAVLQGNVVDDIMNDLKEYQIPEEKIMIINLTGRRE